MADAAERLLTIDEFLNLDDGFPWYQEVLGRKFSESSVRALVRAAILDSPFDLEITKLAVSFDTSTRTVSIDWSVKTTFGDTADVTEVSA